MLISDAVQRYGSKAAIGRVLGIGKAAVSKWQGPLVPRPWATELHVRTNGDLRFDPSIYPGTPEYRAARSAAGSEFRAAA